MQVLKDTNPPRGNNMAAMHFTTIANLTQLIEHKNSDVFLMFFLVLKTFCMVGLKVCDFFAVCYK